MPYFTFAEIDVTPTEFVEKCDKLEFSQLKEEIKKRDYRNHKLNLPDQIFYDSLEFLKDKRHLLSLEEQNFINDLVTKLR